VAADTAAAVARIMIAAAKAKAIANAVNIIMNTVKANAIVMNILMSITIMTNMLSKPIA
jgi:hypothetical protein